MWLTLIPIKAAWAASAKYGHASIPLPSILLRSTYISIDFVTMQMRVFCVSPLCTVPVPVYTAPERLARGADLHQRVLDLRRPQRPVQRYLPGGRVALVQWQANLPGLR